MCGGSLGLAWIAGTSREPFFENLYLGGEVIEAASKVSKSGFGVARLP